MATTWDKDAEAELDWPPEDGVARVGTAVVDISRVADDFEPIDWTDEAADTPTWEKERGQ